MIAKTRKRILNLVRVAVCAGALWLVASGVTLDDRVELTSGERIAGTARILDDQVEVTSHDAAVHVYGGDEVARDEDGAIRVAFGLKTAWRESAKGYLLLALLLNFPVIFPQALRFKVLLSVQKIRITFWEALKLSFAGNFLNFATPLGSHAGDAFKAYFASLHTERKTEAVTTVVLDRIIGLGTLLLVAVGIITFGAGGDRLDTLRPYLLVPAVVGVVGIGIYLSPIFRIVRLPARWAERVPMMDHLVRMDRAARTLAGHVPALMGAVFLTALLQFMALSAYFAVAVALNMEANGGNVLEYFAYFYTGTIVQALPGPPQGLGTVELAYRYLFGPYGSVSQIVCMAFAIRIVVLVCALPGLLVTLSGSYRPKREGFEAIEREMEGDTASAASLQRPIVAT